MLAFHCLLFCLIPNPWCSKYENVLLLRNPFSLFFVFFLFFFVISFIYLFLSTCTSFFTCWVSLLQYTWFFVFCNLITLCSFLLFFFFLQDLPMQRMEMLEMFCTLPWQAHIKYGRFTLRTAHGLKGG